MYIRDGQILVLIIWQYWKFNRNQRIFTHLRLISIHSTFQTHFSRPKYLRICHQLMKMGEIRPCGVAIRVSYVLLVNIWSNIRFLAARERNWEDVLILHFYASLHPLPFASVNEWRNGWSAALLYHCRVNDMCIYLYVHVC